MHTTTYEDTRAQAQLDADLADLLEREAALPRASEIEQGARQAAAELRPTRARQVLAYMDWAEEDSAEAQRRRCFLFAEALPGDYSGHDVLGWIERASQVDPRASLPRFGRSEIEAVWKGEKVPNAPLRVELERRRELEARWAEQTDGDPDGLLSRASEALYEASCRRKGVEPEPGHKADTSHVLRMLGMEPTSGGASPTTSIRTLIHHDAAAAIADALGVSYHDAGV